MLHKSCIAVFAALLVGCSGPVAAQEEPAKRAVGPVLLIGNKGEDSLSFVDLATGQELGRQPTGKAPHEIAISPDGKKAAVVAYGGQDDRPFRRRDPDEAEDDRPDTERGTARPCLA